MRRALLHARRGLGRTAPNPVVGACIVDAAGVVVGDGAHERAGEAHAEVHALEQAGGRARGATMYCTLEPCAHRGRTGPCTERIIAAGIRRVVAAMEDPNPIVSGRGFATLRAHGVDVMVGVERHAAERLNRPFITRVRHHRPFVTMKAATSLDGYLAAAPGLRTAITSAEALRHAQYMRAQVDAVAVGSETVLVDDPRLTVREVFRERPLTRVIFDRRLRVTPAAQILETLDHGPVVIVTTNTMLQSSRASALQERGADIIGAAEEDRMRTALRALADRGLLSVVIEGGAVLHKAAWTAGVVDHVQLYVAPRHIGAGGVPLLDGASFSVADLADLTVTPLGPDVLFEGYVHRPH